MSFVDEGFRDRLAKAERLASSITAHHFVTGFERLLKTAQGG